MTGRMRLKERKEAQAVALSRLVLTTSSSDFFLLSGPMALLLVSLLFLIHSRKVSGADCDLGAADVIFVVKATHLMQREDFDNVKRFMKFFSKNLDIGRDNTSTHVGVVFFDNIGPPQTRIPLTAFGRLSDLLMGIDNLSLLPCGADWCKEKETSFRPALDYAMSRFPKGRMKKIVLIHSGREEPTVTNDLSELTAKDPWLRTLHIFIKGNIVRQGDQEATYLAAYHDPYKRYAERMAQLYTNLSIPIPDPPTPIAIPKTVEQGRITVGESPTLLKINEEVCQQLFSCPPCGGTSGLNPFDKETPIHSKLPQDWKTQVTPAKKINSGGTEDYEYEITGDPPGLKINSNPALEKAKRTASTTTSEPQTVDYLYEDSAPERKAKKRNKRAVMSPLQRDCSCGVQTSSQQDGAPSIEPPDVSKPADGCSGSSTSSSDTSSAAGGCGGTMAGGCTATAGCGGGSALSQNGYSQSAQYYQYYQYPMTQYQYEQQFQQHYYPQHYSQYRSPCRVGNPCQPRPYYYSYLRTPCASLSPCSAQQYYYPQRYPYQYYGYTYSQTGQPSQQQPQPQTESYATPAPVLPSMDNVHDGTSLDQKPKDQKQPEGFKFDNSIFDKLEKYDNNKLEKDAKPPQDPFNARAFGGSQLKRISTASILETIFESLSNATPPPIENFLAKFPEPVAADYQESEATIPVRPVTLKPVDIGSDMSEMRKRSRRSIQWNHHPWHYHMHNHMYNHFYRFHQPAYWTYPSATSVRAHAAPLFTANQVPIPLSTTAPSREQECVVKGVDLAVYIDDVGSMSPSEFNTVKVYLKLVWKLLDTDSYHCQDVRVIVFNR